MMNIHDTAYLHDGGSLQRVNSVLEQPVGPVPREVLNEDKALLFVHELNWAHFEDCALICQFYPYDYSHLAEALSAVSGIEYSIRDILAVGARAQTLARLLNQREGFTAADERLPRRVMQPFASGPIAGIGIADTDFTWFRRRFYELMKWDAETGTPTDGCVRDLGFHALLLA